MAHKSVSFYVSKAFKLLALIAFILVIIPVFGIHLSIMDGKVWLAMLTNTVLFLAIAWYIEEYSYETLSSTQQEKKFRNLNSLRNCIIICVIILLFIISRYLHF